MSKLHPLLERLLGRGFFLVYGPAGTGKTRLAMLLYEAALERGLDPVFIATEPGTVTALEHAGVPYEYAASLDQAASMVAEHAAAHRYLVVDSLNYPYRGGGWPVSQRLLAFTAAVMHEAGGVGTAQVREGGEASGAQYMFPWADAVAETSRHGEVFIVKILRPVERLIAYRVEGQRVRWL